MNYNDGINKFNNYSNSSSINDILLLHGGGAEESSIPAPVVVQGGNTEIVKVAQGSAVVQTVLGQNSKSKSNNNKADEIETENTTAASATVSLQGTTVANQKKKKEKLQHKLPISFKNGTKTKKKIKKRNKKRQIIYVDDDESVGNIMDEIIKSPYEPGTNAEKGESMFQEMKRLLAKPNRKHKRPDFDTDDDEIDNDDESCEKNDSVAAAVAAEVDDDGNNNTTVDDKNTINIQLINMFGPINARVLMDAYELIDISGMIYSELWMNGNIRGNIVGTIPNHLLLLVLQSNRLTKAPDMLLTSICRDLQVYALINDALDDWNLSFAYPLVRKKQNICCFDSLLFNTILLLTETHLLSFSCSNYILYKTIHFFLIFSLSLVLSLVCTYVLQIRATSKKNYKFLRSRRDCFKCAIFVARVYSCYQSFHKKKLEPRQLLEKVQSCLDIMESHLLIPVVSSAGGRSSSLVVLPSSSPAAAAAAAAAGVAADTTYTNTTNSSNTKKRKKLTSDHAVSNNSIHQDATPAVPSVKRKRGRPSKSRTNTTATTTEDVSSEPLLRSPRPSASHTTASSFQIDEEQQNGDHDEEKKTVTSLPSSSIKPSKRRNQVVTKRGRSGRQSHSITGDDGSDASNLSNRDNNNNNNNNNNNDSTNNTNTNTNTNTCASTMQELITQFQNEYNAMGRQYEELGQRYTTMGTILAQIKEVSSSAAASATTTLCINGGRSEQDVRQEVLDEIQKNILSKYTNI